MRMDMGLIIELWNKGMLWDKLIGTHWLPLITIKHSNQVSKGGGSGGGKSHGQYISMTYHLAWCAQFTYSIEYSACYMSHIYIYNFLPTRVLYVINLPSLWGILTDSRCTISHTKHDLALCETCLLIYV